MFKNKKMCISIILNFGSLSTIDSVFDLEPRSMSWSNIFGSNRNLVCWTSELPEEFCQLWVSALDPPNFELRAWFLCARMGRMRRKNCREEMKSHTSLFPAHQSQNTTSIFGASRPDTVLRAWNWSRRSTQTGRVKQRIEFRDLRLVSWEQRSMMKTQSGSLKSYLWNEKFSAQNSAQSSVVDTEESRHKHSERTIK